MIATPRASFPHGWPKQQTDIQSGGPRQIWANCALDKIPKSADLSRSKFFGGQLHYPLRRFPDSCSSSIEIFKPTIIPSF